MTARARKPSSFNSYSQSRWSKGSRRTARRMGVNSGNTATSILRLPVQERSNSRLEDGVAGDLRRAGHPPFKLPDADFVRGDWELDVDLQPGHGAWFDPIGPRMPTELL